MTREAKGTLNTPVAFKVDGRPYALELDANGYLKVALADAAAGQIGSHGYIGGGWQKNPILPGYSARIRAFVSFTSAIGEAVDMTFPVVPGGEIHNISFVTFQHNDPVNRLLRGYIMKGVDDVPILYNAASPQWYLNVIDTRFILDPGDTIRARSNWIAAGCSLYAWYWATRIDIDL
jgi:hypothetical protein